MFWGSSVVERTTDNRDVDGSNPSPRTKGKPMQKQPPIIDGALEYRVEIHEGIRKTFQDLICSEPGCENRMSTAVGGDFKPASVIMNMAKKRGWLISGNRYKNRICPLHSEPRKEETTVVTQLTKPKDDPIPSEAARAQRRAVFFEMDSAYEGKSYKPGFSDQMIADKLKVSVGMVRQIREENFGPVGHSSEVTEIRNLITMINKRIDTIETKAIDALTLAETTAQSLRSDVAILEDKLKKLEELL